VLQAIFEGALVAKDFEDDVCRAVNITGEAIPPDPSQGMSSACCQARRRYLRDGCLRAHCATPKGVVMKIMAWNLNQISAQYLVEVNGPVVAGAGKGAISDHAILLCEVGVAADGARAVGQ